MNRSPAENLLEPLVHEFAVGDGDLAFQHGSFFRVSTCVRQHLVFEQLVHQRVHAADKKARHRSHIANRQTLANAVFQRGDVRLRHSLVMLHRKHQRDVDVDAFAQELPDGRDALARGRDFDEQVRAIDRRVQPPRVSERAFRVVRQLGRNFEAHVSVAAVRRVKDRAQHIGCRLDVGDGQRVIDVRVARALS